MTRTLALMLIACSMASCVMGIPDSGPAPPPKPEPCEVWVIVRPDNTARCVSRERMRRELCRLVECSL